MRELMWQYPNLSAWLICGTMLLATVVIIALAYSFKSKDTGE